MYPVKAYPLNSNKIITPFVQKKQEDLIARSKSQNLMLIVNKEQQQQKNEFFLQKTHNFNNLQAFFTPQPQKQSKQQFFPEEQKNEYLQKTHDSKFNNQQSHLTPQPMKQTKNQFFAEQIQIDTRNRFHEKQNPNKLTNSRQIYKSQPQNSNNINNAQQLPQINSRQNNQDNSFSRQNASNPSININLKINNLNIIQNNTNINQHLKEEIIAAKQAQQNTGSGFKKSQDFRITPNVKIQSRGQNQESLMTNSNAKLNNNDNNEQIIEQNFGVQSRIKTPIRGESPKIQKSRYNQLKLSIEPQQNAQSDRSISILQEEYTPVITKCSFKTKPGSLPGKSVKTNQDSYIVIENFMNNKKQYIYSVCDGHGVNGHHASQYIKQNLPINIEKFLKQENPQNENNAQIIKQCLIDAFLKSDKELLESGIDMLLSGSTCVLCYVNNNAIYCANLGDSRAIIVEENNQEYIFKELSIDQKPENELEQKRIIAAGGRVMPYKDYDGTCCGPHRVWLKSENIPGLAMSRSFGDYVAHQVGVSSEPEILTEQINQNSKFMVIASDGVWEFFNNKQVMDMCIPYIQKNDPDGACAKLVKKSVAAWKREDEVVDDITVIIVIFGKQ